MIRNSSATVLMGLGVSCFGVCPRPSQMYLSLHLSGLVSLMYTLRFVMVDWRLQLVFAFPF